MEKGDKLEQSPSLDGEQTLREPLAEVVYHDTDVFGHEEDHEVCIHQMDILSSLLVENELILLLQIIYKTLSWELVAVLMIAEIVSNGMLSLPSSLAVVGLVPGVVLIVFLGSFGLFTSWILIQFKLRHPEGMAAAP